MSLNNASKADGRRSIKHEAYYGSLFPRVAERKDKHVYQSSHGKFPSVEKLVEHQKKVEAKKGNKNDQNT